MHTCRGDYTRSGKHERIYDAKPYKVFSRQGCTAKACRWRLCASMCGREERSLLISCITAVISTLFITSSMCSLRFKIFKSVICQHYEVNTHSCEDWCPIRHRALHFTWPHIYHQDLTWPFVARAGKDTLASVCNFSTAAQTCCQTQEKN